MKPSSAATSTRAHKRALYSNKDIVAVQGQGLPGELAQGLKFGAAGPGHLVGEDAPVQDLAGLRGRA